MVVLVIVIADLSYLGTGSRTRIHLAIQEAARNLQRPLQSILGESIFRVRFILSSFILVIAVLVLYLLVSSVLTDEQANSKWTWVLPTTLCAGALSMMVSRIVTNRLSNQQQTIVKLLWLLLWLLAPVLLWLAVMHLGTWLEWRNTRSPLAYASEWFYAQVYDDYFRNSAGLSITIAIATTISLPIVVPIIFIGTWTIRLIINLKRGVLGIFVIILFSATQLYENF